VWNVLHRIFSGWPVTGDRRQDNRRVGMGRGGVVYRFGLFELDPAKGRLSRDGQPLAVSDAAFAILAHLVDRAPDVISRDAVAKAGWRGTASAASVEKAISRLRQVLDDGSGATPIETVKNRGYRFVATVDEVPAQDTGVPDGADGEAFRAFVNGRRGLATLNRRAIADARREFERAIDRVPDYAPMHIGLSTACSLAFEATRFDEVCDLDALAGAVDHARHAALLDPESADAWSALGFALSLRGETDAAAVAAWKAVALEPRSWRHSLRLAFVSWGDERIDAAAAALALRPQLALAHWLQATVLIARGAFDAALARLRDGCAAQDRQPVDTAAYPAVGLHLLRGLVLAAHDRLAEAVAAFEAELSAPDRGQVYARECAANTWYALGAVRLRQRDFSHAEAGFQRALDIAPAHLFSLAALGRPIPSLAPDDPRAADAGIARAIALVRGNRHVEAAQVYADTLASARAPNAGWILPVEPVLCPSARPDVWDPVLTSVQQRAT
jgi:DNA-binding winged helix-turn-helix (wHTH) protein/Tfp pilus assembly protein PilF